MTDTTTTERAFTPREIVSELDRFIISQNAAKRAVAIALRNRWRRRRVDPALRDEIAPKNIILMGHTGSGKTEIARRLARLAEAPFVKVEATKYTEVGYVGRDVESMVRDLVENSIKLVKDEAEAVVQVRAKEAAVERVLDLLLPRNERKVGFPTRSFDGAIDAETPADDSTRAKFRQMLDDGALDDRQIELDVTQSGGGPMMQMFAQPGLEDMASGLQDALQNALGAGARKKRRKMLIKEAMPVLINEEAQKLIDNDAIQREAIRRAEESGIIFIDEIDKIAVGRTRQGGPDVSREGVQRDILPIVEGCSVTTKYGAVKTDHVLFIAAGAFHMSKPSDLIPELQGRFPIRVELQALTEDDFVRILTEPENSLTRQYTALLATEGVTLTFTDDGIRALAKTAARVNHDQEDIGARRLYTVLEHLLEEVSFTAPDRRGVEININAAFVDDKLAPTLAREDLSKYVL